MEKNYLKKISLYCKQCDGISYRVKVLFKRLKVRKDHSSPNFASLNNKTIQPMYPSPKIAIDRENLSLHYAAISFRLFDF